MPATWKVPSQSNPSVKYTVVFDGERFSCSCPDFTYRHRECKHVYAVKLSEGLLKADIQPVKPAKQYVEHPFVREGVVEDREYQRTLVNEALEANTLVVLPTALGKTVVAELVAAELLHRHPGSKIIVMAPTKPLALQHRDSFLKHLKLSDDEAAIVTGETKDRESLWTSHRIRAFFATPQTVWNDVRAGLVGLEEFCLLVFDECHRSRSRYAYTKLASEYVRRCPWPLILALTASPGSEEDKVLEVCRNLLVERVVWRVEEDEEVAGYIPGVKVSWERVDLPPEYEEVRRALKKMVESLVRQLYGSGMFKTPVEAVNRKTVVQFMNRLRAEIDSGVKGANMHYMALCSEILSLFHALELVESQHIYSLRKYLEEVSRSELRSHRMLAKTHEFTELVRLAARVERDHPKLERLVQLVVRHLTEKPDDRVMVFANIRHTADVIVGRLRENGLAAELFVGKAEGKEGPRMTQEEQRNILQRFREGGINILVATSIGEEGLDIPECGYVIFYEPAVSGIRYIQRRGRTGRKLPGKVTILMARNTVDEYYFREGYRRARRMTQILEKVSERLKEFKISRRGPRPEPGQPWPWRREAVEIEVPETDVEVEVSETTGKPEQPVVKPVPSYAGVDIPEVKPVKTGPSSREVYHYARYLYRKLLEKGLEGLSEAEVMADPDQMPDTIRAAVKHLERDGLVTRVQGRIVAKAVVRSLSRHSEGEIHTIRVEKIYPGFAVVWVDDRFKARLEPAAYNGPRELIRKGSQFKARVLFRRVDGVLNVSVQDVLSV
ncbi:MAG: helicase-related protein [Candidatus Caldarchaeum sp.]